uniref:Uncharacterized protein n=1 Tax=Phaseolus vulgaris TaxID=3885 RepID=V7CDR1_PHAVU|nr:hypothetical protein PHAVU_003G208100g [Phaseolus vulgaris]ESW27508.1 hypothetical protein PHAVU_003G208100g [Phaseolus vulgaris]
MLYYQMLHSPPSFLDPLKALQADIQHANVLAASIPRGKGEDYLQMKLVYSKLAPIFLFLFQWLDYSCSCCSCLPSSHLNLFRVHTNGKSDMYSSGRKAAIREFFSVILPSLQRLHDDSVEANIAKENDHNIEMISNRSKEYKRKGSDLDLEREHECGICLESTTKILYVN